MVGHELQVPVGVANRGVDVEAQIFGMKIVVECCDEGSKPGLCVGGNLFKVEREAAIGRVGCQKGVDLLYEAGACRGVGEKVANLRHPEALPGVVVVDQREDVKVYVVRFDGSRNLGLTIDLMDRSMIDDWVGRVVGSIGVNLAVRRDDVQPFGE